MVVNVSYQSFSEYVHNFYKSLMCVWEKTEPPKGIFSFFEFTFRVSTHTQKETDDDFWSYNSRFPSQCV